MKEIRVLVDNDGQAIDIASDDANLPQITGAAYGLATFYMCVITNLLGSEQARRIGGDFCAAIGKATDFYISQQEEY